ncbi:MAG: triose-phosphate isomerase [Clostridia bacterium]|nr:triose-phosphate isomerase [Clostridia bacterium]
MNKLIIGNFKMNTDISEFTKYLDELLPKTKTKKAKAGIALPFTHLYLASQKLVSTDISLGAQNVFYENNGAYTGEVSPTMLKSVGTNFVIVGHSERRKSFGDTNEKINKKILKCLEHNLKIVLCVGEKEVEKKTGKTLSVLRQQLDVALKNVYENELKNIIIAYEPVWAIGTGKTPTTKEIENTISEIRNMIATGFSQKAASSIKILYGGSAKLSNYLPIINLNGVDGLLVGGASLNAEEFSKMLNLK